MIADLRRPALPALTGLTPATLDTPHCRAQALHAPAESGDFVALDALETLVQDMDLMRSLYTAFGRL
jgi:hypothetical protein